VLLQKYNYWALCFNSIITGIVGERQKEDIMKKTICLIVCALFMVVTMSGVALSGEKKAAESEVIITGTIYGNQLMDKEGQVFSIADTKKGNELATIFGKTVKVKGTVLEDEGLKQINVSTYKVINK